MDKSRENDVRHVIYTVAMLLGLYKDLIPLYLERAKLMGLGGARAAVLESYLKSGTWEFHEVSGSSNKVYYVAPIKDDNVKLNDLEIYHQICQAHINRGSRIGDLLDLMTKNADKVLESITSSIPNDAEAFSAVKDK